MSFAKPLFQGARILSATGHTLPVTQFCRWWGSLKFVGKGSPLAGGIFCLSLYAERGNLLFNTIFKVTPRPHPLSCSTT